MCPTVIDKSQPIESMGSRLRDHTRVFDSDVRARSNSRRTLPGEGIVKEYRYLNGDTKALADLSLYIRVKLYALVGRN